MMQVRRKKQAFTLIEILIAFGLIGGLMALIIPRIMNNASRAKAKTTAMILGQIKEAILDFDSSFGRTPTQQEGLKVLYESNGDPKWRGPYATMENQDGVPVDGYKEPIIYNRPPKEEGKRFKRYELISFGGEGKDESNSDRKDWIVDGE